MSRLALVLLVLATLCSAQSDDGLQSSVTAGHQAWADGMRNGNAARIAAAFASDAVLCPEEGACAAGTAAIQDHFRRAISSLGRARTAGMTSASLVRDRNLAYEWGAAEATYSNGRSQRSRYLTVWTRARGAAGWQILRHLELPSGREARGRRGQRPQAAEQSTRLRCESGDMRRHTCAAPAEIVRAELARQISGSACTQGRSWGWEGNSIWVDRGCRADFTVFYYDQSDLVFDAPEETGAVFSSADTVRTLRCESGDMRFKLCSADRPIVGARVVRKLSDAACTQDSSWGWRSDGVWVNRGCRADFEVTLQ